MERDDGDGPCADHKQYDVSCDIGDMIGDIGADRFLTPRNLGRFDIGSVIPVKPEEFASEQMANDGLALGPNRLLKKRPERRFKVPPPEISD
jgi:hypothetical protein